MNPTTPQNTPLDEDALAQADADAIYTAVFEQLVAGHGQMALMFLGVIENPHTGRREEPQLEAAKIFIDQVEMLSVKTRGNLNAAESQLLERTLALLHREFASAIEAQADPDAAANPPASPAP